MADFKLPDLGEGVHEGQVIRLFVKEGDQIAEDQPLMEVETDKAAVEIPSPFSGMVEKWHVEESQIVNVGDVMVTIKETAEGAARARDHKALVGAGVRSESARSTQIVEPSPQPSPRGRGSKHKPASPATRKLARSLGVDLETVDGSGPGGRVTRADIESAAKGTPDGEGQRTDTARLVSVGDSPGREAGRPPQPVDLSQMTGEDASDQYGSIKKHPLTQARKTIAANMAQAWSTIPHVTDCDDADVTELEQLRKGYPAPQNDTRRITMLAFVIRAVAGALTRHPEFNAHFNEENHEIVYKRYINVAVGVHTERGLIAPVIRDADRLNVIQIADALDEIVTKARTASFTVSDTRGGTYTISNAGAFGGSRYSTPIISPGQCAVLAIGRTKTMPWVVDGEIAPRRIMPLSHSFDHRVADGGQEIAFLQDVIGQLENPARLLL